MKTWNMRSREVAYLLNPAFCGRILFSSVKTYKDKTGQAMPFPLIYLILPLVLHKKTREQISSKTKLYFWIKQHPELLIDFPQRTKSLVPITNEAMEFLMQARKIVINLNGELEIQEGSSLSKNRYVDDEIKDCLTKAEHVARWFTEAGNVETIYIELGVRP